MRWRHRRGRRPLPVKISFNYLVNQILPVPIRNPDPILIGRDELEALRLVDFEGKTQEEAAMILGCSRVKVSRLLNSGRKKLVQAIVEGRPIQII